MPAAANRKRMTYHHQGKKKRFLSAVISFLLFSANGELTDFLPWQWAHAARLTGQKVRSNDWFAPRSGAGQSGGLTKSDNSPFAPRSGANGAGHREPDFLGDPVQPLVST
jgi:hypothetical protein